MEEIKRDNDVRDSVKPRKTGKAARIAKIFITTILGLICLLLLVNAFLCIFMPHYYPTFGNKRLFSVVTDSMQGEIDRGSMIVCTVPASEDEIEVGTIITFEVQNSDGSVSMILTHRVIAINKTSSGPQYITRGDNAPSADSFRTPYSSVIGVYSGEKVAVLGYVFGFLQSESGAIFLIIALFILITLTLVLDYYNGRERENKLVRAAVLKSAQILAETGRGDDEITIALNAASADPKSRKQQSERNETLTAFINSQYSPSVPVQSAQPAPVAATEPAETTAVAEIAPASAEPEQIATAREETVAPVETKPVEAQTTVPTQSEEKQAPASQEDAKPLPENGAFAARLDAPRTVQRPADAYDKLPANYDPTDDKPARKVTITFVPKSNGNK